ncbi:MAG TPA: non-canonical purine NTP pyrophosphatase [Gemmatimonadales bacterium]|jgi:XTP/dITP diphosphohydrolase
MSRKLLIGTRNAGKRREIAEILCELTDTEVVFPDDIGVAPSPAEESLESADSYGENARHKAEYFARVSGLPTAADDSGLEVFALGGAPGVRSRRFALPAADQDAANNAELLRRLSGAPAPKRRARYRCVVVFVERPGGAPHTFEGICGGSILDVPKGKGGFGYDPLFLSDDIGRSFGEAEAAEKHQVSHRGRAFRAFAQWYVANPSPS